MGLSDFNGADVAKLAAIPEGKRWNCILVTGFPLSDPDGAKRCLAANARDSGVKQYQYFELPDKNVIGWFEIG